MFAICFSHFHFYTPLYVMYEKHQHLNLLRFSCRLLFLLVFILQISVRGLTFIISSMLKILIATLIYTRTSTKFREFFINVVIQILLMIPIWEKLSIGLLTFILF